LRGIPTFLLVLSLGCAPVFATETDSVVSRVRQTVEDFNKGDAAALARDMVDAPQIIDEFPPFFWGGPNAMSDWAHAFTVETARQSISATSMRLLKVTHVDVRGDSAYVVVPAICTFTLRSGQRLESGILTLALTKSDQTWRISAFSWTKG
jgi:ketosteroid isomerase-like protein